MKRLFYAALAVLMTSFASCATDNVKVNYADVSAPVKSFISKNFAGEKVQTVKLDKDDATPDYDIYLLSGTKVEIDTLGNWKEIENNKDGVKADLLPAQAQAYMASKYAGVKIVKIEKDYKGYEVHLVNGVEVEFDLNGNFIKVDA